MSRPALAHPLEPLAAALWALLLIWTLWVAAVWSLGIGEIWLGLGAHSPTPSQPELRRAVLLLAQNAEAIWLVLAVANLHLSTSAEQGLRLGRRWLLTLFIGGGILGLLLGWIGWVSFTDQLGKKFGPVPLGFVFLWPTLVLGARSLALRLWPRLGHGRLSAATGIAVAVSALLLEPVGRLVRVWWLWSGPQPVLLAVLIGAAAGGSALLLRQNTVIPRLEKASARPAAIFLLLQVLALCGLWRLLANR
jgi:hypothetical protein